MRAICSIEGCNGKVLARGWCHKHYERWRSHGDPLYTVNIDADLAKDFIKKAINWNLKRDCLIWPFSKSHGYAVIGGRLVHRIVCRKAHGKAPREKPCALHSCGKGHIGCINPWHLRWGSKKDNVYDAMEHGTAIQPKGEDHGNHKLTVK